MSYVLCIVLWLCYKSNDYLDPNLKIIQYEIFESSYFKSQII